MDGEVHGVASLAYRRSLEVGKKRWMRTVCSGRAAGLQLVAPAAEGGEGGRSSSDGWGSEGRNDGSYMELKKGSR